MISTAALFLLALLASLCGGETYYYQYDGDSGGYGDNSYDMAEPDYYADLGVEMSATAREIKKKFRALALEFHPDKRKEDPNAAAAFFQNIQTAYEVLNNPEKRDAYDDTGLSTFTNRWEWVNALQRRGKPVNRPKDFFRDFDIIKQYDRQSFMHDLNVGRESFIVDFYAPWCSHCLDAAPSVRSMAVSLDAENSKTTVGAVNCEQHGNLCNDLGVRSYPTLKLFYMDGDSRDASIFNGEGHVAEDIMEWIRRTTETKAASLTQSNFHDSVILSKSLYIVAFNAGSWCGPCTRMKREIRDAAWDLDGVAKLGIVDCDSQASLCSQYNLPHYPYLVMYATGPKEKAKYTVLNFQGAGPSTILEVFKHTLPAILSSTNLAPTDDEQ